MKNVAKGQYKNFSVRRFRTDLKYRLKLLAAMLNMSIEEAHNVVVEAGLNAVEGSLANRGK